MPRSRLLIAVGGTLGGLAFVLGLAAVLFEPLLVFVAIPFMISGYVIWFHGTGRMEFRTQARAERARAENATFRSARDRADADDGEGARWADPEWRRRRERAKRDAREAAAGGRRRRERDVFGDGPGRARRPGAGATAGPTTEEAYRRLDLDPGSSTEEIRRAYREKVKETHPDADGGSEEEFKRITEAYETLDERVE